KSVLACANVQTLLATNAATNVFLVVWNMGIILYYEAILS
ncbi:MAG: hypothetical protein ACI9ES_002779, partial [Oceanospirillaceae bacterium]